MEEEKIDVKDTEKFLPIGTVVLLKGATKRLMISGYCAIDQEKKDEMWDYSGCMYPEGFLSSTQSFLFDHSQIAKIYSVGYKDSEEEEFQQKLKNYINSNDSGESNNSEDVADDGYNSNPNDSDDITESTFEEESDEVFSNQLLNNSTNVVDTVPMETDINTKDESIDITFDNGTEDNTIIDEAPVVQETPIEESQIIDEKKDVAEEEMVMPAIDEQPLDVNSIINPNPEPATIPIAENNAELTESQISDNMGETKNDVISEVTAENTTPSVDEIVSNINIPVSDSDTVDNGADSTNPSTTPNPNNATDLSEFDQWLNQTGPYANNNNNNQ